MMMLAASVSTALAMVTNSLSEFADSLASARGDLENAKIAFKEAEQEEAAPKDELLGLRVGGALRAIHKRERSETRMPAAGEGKISLRGPWRPPRPASH